MRYVFREMFILYQSETHTFYKNDNPVTIELTKIKNNR